MLHNFQQTIQVFHTTLCSYFPLTLFRYLKQLNIMISAKFYPVRLKSAKLTLITYFNPFLFQLQTKNSYYPDDENYEFSGYPDGMYDEEDEIGTGYLDDDFEEKNVSKKDPDDRDDLEMVCNTLQLSLLFFYSIPIPIPIPIPYSYSYLYSYPYP